MRISIPLIQGELNGRRGWVAGFYYVRNCLNALAMLPTEMAPNVNLFVPETFSETVIFPEYKDKATWLNIVRVPDQIINNPDDHADLEKQINAYPCDIIFPLINLPPFTLSGPALGWIPDFQHRHRPDFFSEDEYRIRELMFGFIVGYCNKVVCSSQTVKVDLQNFYPSSPDKGKVLKFTSIIPEQYLTQAPEEVLKRWGLNQKYIYLPNQFWIHKNHKVVFEAWKHLKDHGVDYLLVCTGSSEDYRFPNYYQELETYIDEHDLRPNIRLLGFLSREEQIQLYRGASAILQPSLFEGWSTSIEDAKSLGKALIVSDIPVHREQCGSEAHYFDKNNAEALAITLQQVWDSLPDGYDADAETTGIARCRASTTSFASQLMQALEETLEASVFQHTDKQLLLRLITHLTREMNTSETNRAAQSGQIKELTQRLRESETDRTARLGQIKELTQRLRESETDRTARLGQIKELTQRLRESETDRTARSEQIQTLTTLVKATQVEIQTAQAELETVQAELETVQAENKELNSYPEVKLHRKIAELLNSKH